MEIEDSAAVDPAPLRDLWSAVRWAGTMVPRTSDYLEKEHGSASRVNEGPTARRSSALLARAK